ncbi:hypothetical protein [Elizabethkingia anophelis]|uniref:Uncharacterized protein n=1 Tax=Elizabethkingia anophelis TaxID=1117645 RepID=A0A494J326_9FLAO|nr:hypothetical protein [Elizabethkingia anophelis]AQX50183.1 hypothetical protein AYC66_05615 [Elizabethkingia anophelis]ELB0068875.1 hypothetical protein [Elizabethkingia anophelis]ELB1893961.1 hypothetical protein [Elizabethkingia anophelis]MCT3641618.1 hypothetical protein [Elizabethkingia anophelis]MCT4199230.1 hypothetical protein [Elizabethkingia anophelis]
MENQDKKITDYLIEKRLPLDIMLEVKDHMTDQIQDLEVSKNMTFDEAFSQAQLSWEEELKTNRPSLTTYNEFLATPFVRKIYWQKRKSVIFRSVGFALCILILLILAATELDITSFRIVFIAIVILSTFTPVLYYIRYFRVFRFTDKFANKVSVYQREFIVWSYILNGFNFFWISQKQIPDFYQLLKAYKVEDALYTYCMFAFLLFWLGMAYYCLLFSQRFVKSVQQIKKQLIS